MREKIEEARLQSRRARKRALTCADERAKSEWLTVARMWEDLAREYGEVQKLKARTAGGEA